MILIVDDYLFLAGGFIAVLWGLAHLLPIRAITRMSGGDENKPRPAASWFAEGLALILIGAVVLLTVATAGTENDATRAVTWSAAAAMFAFTAVNLFTGIGPSRASSKFSAIVDGLAGTLFLIGSFINS